MKPESMGGLRDNLLTLLLDYFEEELNKNALNDEGEFAAGVWSGKNNAL